MQTYIGSKVIQAKPMCRGDYNLYKGWKLPENENPMDEGYLVKYSDSYESWSPKETFDLAYRLLSNDEKSLISNIKELN